MKKHTDTIQNGKVARIIAALVVFSLVALLIIGYAANISDKNNAGITASREARELNQRITKDLAESYLLKAKVDAIGTSYHDSIEKEMDEIQDLLDQAFALAAITPKNRSEEDEKRLKALITLINSHGIVELKLGKDGYIDIISEDD